jgi:hypothetical protein
LFNKNHYSTMYIYLKYCSIYKKNMRLAAICIKYYTTDHPPLNISCIVIYEKNNKCGGYFLMRALMRNREFFYLA